MWNSYVAYLILNTDSEVTKYKPWDISLCAESSVNNNKTQ